MDLSIIIRRAIDIGRRHGTISFGQLNELFNELPPSSADRLGPEAIEHVFNALSDQGINIEET
jgi:hypothetical protein